MGLSLDVTPLLYGLCDAVSKRRAREYHVCKQALDCIRSAKSNFERIVAKEQYGNDQYEKLARTQYSFEKVYEDILKLSRVRKFRGAAKKVARLCENELSRPADDREAEEVLDCITQLEEQLAKYVGRL